MTLSMEVEPLVETVPESLAVEVAAEPALAAPVDELELPQLESTAASASATQAAMKMLTAFGKDVLIPLLLMFSFLSLYLLAVYWN